MIVGPSGMNNDPAGKEIKLIPRAQYAAGMTITRADTAAVCIVAKSWDYHVKEALQTTLEEGVAMVAGSAVAGTDTQPDTRVTAISRT